MENIFQLKDIQYKDILQIREMNIPKGKVTCIIGESGSGKTTLLKLLNCLISPNEGSLLYQGKSFEEWDTVELRREVVMLGQNPVTFPGNIRDNLNIGLKFADKEQVSDEQLQKYLKLAHLGKSLDQNTDSLSGGEKQRLALARVLLLNPEVLLLDEPSSALDEETEILIIEETIAYTKGHGKTLIMVTHSRMIAEAYGECVIRISKGRFAGEGEQ